MNERLWFKIGETATRVGATPKELRYWERVIPELKPRRSKGNLRYYHQEELENLQRIRQWLTEGFTVADCRELLRGQSPRPHGSVVAPATELAEVVEALRALHRRLSRPVGAPPEPSEPPSPKLPRPRKARPVEAAPVSPESPKPSPARAKAKPEPSPLGRMWAQVRLPLDWDD